MSKNKKFILFLILLTIPLGCLAVRPTEVTYPNLDNAMAPVTTKTLLSSYIRYAFYLFLSFSGLICFGSMVWAGFLFLTSTGDPGKRKSAVSRIWLAFVGSAIILGSYLIFNTINPQLITINLGLQSLEGVILYSDSGCTDPIVELANDSPVIEDYEGNTIAASSLKFLAKPGTLDVMLFPSENYAASAQAWTKISNEGAEEGECFSFDSANSIKFFWQLPGVYLCTGTYDDNWICSDEERWLPADTALVEPEFNENINGIRFKNEMFFYTVPGASGEAREECMNRCLEQHNDEHFVFHPSTGICECHGDSYGAVLFEEQDWNDGFMKGGKCEIFTLPDENLSGNYIDTTTSSIKTFVNGGVGAGGVWFCEEPDSTKEDCYGPYAILDEDGGFVNLPHENIPDASSDTNNEGISSIIIEGHYLVALASEQNGEGNCNVFTESDSNLRDNAVGREGCTVGYFGCHDSVSSVRVIPLQGNKGTPTGPQAGVPGEPGEPAEPGTGICPNPCPTVDVQQCSDDGNVQTCQARTGCNNWTTTSVCSGNPCACNDGVCQCVSACAINGCSAQGAYTCLSLPSGNTVRMRCALQANNCLGWQGDPCAAPLSCVGEGQCE